ncbi:hypothetical protein AeRB84_016284 [Aphanomyces euteiches]|nr:hypothetical protein AeRB84_016284 [Aphanomyces euteiches]
MVAHVSMYAFLLFSAFSPWLALALVSIPVTVLKNGASGDGVQVELTADLVSSGESLAAYLSTIIDVDGLYTDETKTSSKAVADRVYTGTGKAIRSFEDLSPNDKLYLVPEGLLFVWPFAEFGHRVVLESHQSPTGKPIILESFSDSPRVFKIYNFFTNDEADKLVHHVSSITAKADRLKRSAIGLVGDGEETPLRTSENAYDSDSPTAKAILKRSFDLLNIGEFDEKLVDGLQLLRYQQKQAYVTHDDWFDLESLDDFNFDPKAGGANRFATVFLYLSNVTRGGQTVFPYAEMPPGVHHMAPPTDEEMALFDEGTWESRLVHACYTKMATYPVKSTAILFYNQLGDGTLDEFAGHGGGPVLEGTKWAANLWVDFVNGGFAKVYLYLSGELLSELEPGHEVAYNVFRDELVEAKDEDGNVFFAHKLTYKDGKVQTIQIPASSEKTEL